jgi:hypothetical protein
MDVREGDTDSFSVQITREGVGIGLHLPADQQVVEEERYVCVVQVDWSRLTGSGSRPRVRLGQAHDRAERL